MKSLHDLPSELLSRILFGKSTSFLTIPLWLSGDIELQRKLASGLEFIALRDRSTASCSRFPKLLWSLRGLRHLTLDRGNGILATSPEETGRYIQRLVCSKLETLRIRCKSVDAVFRLFNHEPEPEPPALDDKEANAAYDKLMASYSEYKLQNYARGPSHLIDLESLFPCLTRLELLAHGSFNSARFTVDDLAGLPNSLTVLRVPEIYVDEDAQGLFSRLPRSLTKLNALVQQNGDFAYFEPEVIRSIKDEISGIDAPPSSSASLTADADRSEDECREFLADNLRLVQQKLVERVWRDPPPFLRKIRLIELNIDLNAIGVSFLPRTLEETELDIKERHLLLNASTAHTLPPNMKTVSTTLFQNDFVADLGPTRWVSEILPKHFETFNSSHYFPLPFEYTFDFLASLPPSVTCISDGKSTSESLDWSQFGGQTSSRSCWPPFLRTLHLSAFAVPLDMVKHLPRTLTSLSCNWTENQLPDESSDSWPPVLQELYLLTSSSAFITINASLPLTLTLVSIRPLSRECLSGDHFKLLPSSILDLSLSTYDEIPGTPPEYPLVLPIKLTNLRLDNWLFEMFATFPATLKHLRLGSPGFTPTQDMLEDVDLFATLPAGLERFHGNGLGFYKLVFSHLSFATLTNLRFLDVQHWSTFSPRLLQTLSKRLRVLRIRLTELTEEFAPFINPLWRLDHSDVTSRNNPKEAELIKAKYWRSLVPSYVN